MADPQKTNVNLRIEGKTRTIFEGPVPTCGHMVATRSGGIHHCDGTNNNNSNPCVGPTCTTALDDGNMLAKFGFDAIFFDQRDDFFIMSIGGETPTGKDFWMICLNLQPISVGGCQQKVKEGDEVLFAYATQGVTAYYLKLTGPTLAVLFTPVTLVVTDQTGRPVSGAQVEGHLSDDLGRVTLTFVGVGTQILKAEKQPDSIRSNVLAILVIVGPTAKL